MYIIRNALKCIGRSKGRNILIGVIVLVIAISSCLGLSIRQAAESAKEETLGSLSVTATISFDRTSAMAQMSGREEGGTGKGFDRSSFADMMGESSSLSLEEYLTYAQAQSVKEFYYSMAAYVNGTDTFEPVSTDVEEQPDRSTEETEEPADARGEGPGVMGGKGDRIFGSNSDFTVIGYSGEAAMTPFLNGTAAISEGVVFAEGAASYECIITEELASFNDISVGDSIRIANPNNEEELYTLTVVGLYSDSSANASSFSLFGSTSTDPANQIYMSYATLQEILTVSEAAADEDDSAAAALSGTLTGTYVFEDVEAYEAFEEEARALGLDESYTVSSSDMTAFEISMTPLNTLSTIAGYFLLVILVIGAVILVVLNIFNVRERKYEIGVLTAMGMKKGKVALQFLTEIFVVTLAAVVIGAAVGAVSSVPVTNALLESQVASQNSQAEQVEMNFGRGNMGGGKGMDMSDAPDDIGAAYEKGGFLSGMLGANGENSYVTEISSAMNLTVVVQMLGIGILLTLIAGMVSMLFVMRYEPLKILANRD